MTKQAITAAAYVAKKVPHVRPRLGIILGSGLGNFADHLSNPVSLAYQDIPEFPRCSIEGHSGEMILGHIDQLPVVCLKGRVHFLEGVSNEEMQTFVRTLKCLGCGSLLILSAVGSLCMAMLPGSLMLVTDHINFQGRSPLTGPNDATVGPRFTPMENAYDPELRQKMLAAASALSLSLYEGVYLSVLGPSFETPAEIRLFQQWGADAVGMSTVPEVLIARHCGLKVCVVATVTNLAAGLSNQPVSHAETLENANLAADKVAHLVLQFARKF